MSQRPSRAYRAARCPRCALIQRPCGTACLCAAWPQVQTHTQISVVAHFRELRKSSNTARLAALVLPRCQILVRGGPDVEQGRQVEGALSALDPEHTLVLFPSEDALPLTALEPQPAGWHLVVPDGTWSQARRLVRRYAALRGAQCVRLPAEVTSYQLRRGAEPGLLCTLEAIARALGILGDAAAAATLGHVLSAWQQDALGYRFSPRL